MATNQGLRSPEPILSKARQQFIKNLQQKQQFEADCAVIVPELQRLWSEKIFANHSWTVNEQYQINWEHYLYNYPPQLLVKAINRLASRRAKDKATEAAPIQNVSAYFKALVQDLQRKAQLRLEGEATDHIWLMEDRPGKVGIRLDSGDSGAVYLTYDQAKDLAEQLTEFCKDYKPQSVQEEGHVMAREGRQAPVSMETVAFNMMEESERCPKCGLPPANDPMLPSGTHICK